MLPTFGSLRHVQQELESMQWTDSAVKFLLRNGGVPQHLAVDFTITIRQGVPDGSLL